MQNENQNIHCDYCENVNETYNTCCASALV